MRWLCKGAGVLSFFIVAVYVAAGRMTIFMPGPLPAVHEKDPGLACSKCHRSWRAAQSGFTGCASCKTNKGHETRANLAMHGGVRDEDCARCHVEHVSQRDVAAAIREELKAGPGPSHPDPTKVRPKSKPLGGAWEGRAVDVLFRHARHMQPMGKTPGQDCEACHVEAVVVPMPIHPKRAAKKKCGVCHGESFEADRRLSGAAVINLKATCAWCHHQKDEAH